MGQADEVRKMPDVEKVPSFVALEGGDVRCRRVTMAERLDSTKKGWGRGTRELYHGTERKVYGWKEKKDI